MSADIHDLENSDLNQGELSSNAQTETTITKDTEYVSKVISDFINNEGTETTGVAAAPSSSSQQFHDRRDIIKALSKLQKTYKSEYKSGQRVNINTDEFKKALLNSVAQLSSAVIPKSMNQIDGRTIDFVEMIFGAFLRDHNISHAIKNLLLKMQIPVIKIAMLDKKFLHDPKHAARNVLDTIAHLGIGIDDRENTLYKTIELIIDQLLNSFDQNIASFHTMLNSLSRLTKIEKKKHEEKTSEATQLIIKEHARQVVLTELQRHVVQKDLPKAVQPLVLKHWSTIMFQNYMRHGKDSEEWAYAIDTLKQIVKNLRPIITKRAWQALSDSYEMQLEDIRTSLATTKQDRSSVDNSLQALKETYEINLNQVKFDDCADDAEHAKLVEEVEVQEAEHQQTEQERMRSARETISHLPRDVKQGVWFELYAGEDHPVRRLKLSVIMFDEAKLVFVDRLGANVIKKDAADFIEELNSNKSRILADHSIFDHALSQVINSIVTKR